MKRPAVQRVRKRNAALSHWQRSSIGFVPSLLAVCCQILLLATLALAPLPGDEPLTNPPICHVGDDGTPARHNPGHPLPCCLVCVLCLSHAAPIGILPLAPVLPEPPAAVAMRLDAPRQRAPPVRRGTAAQARGPPALI